jgi:CheY-like chemotaxis protein
MSLDHAVHDGAGTVDAANTGTVLVMDDEKPIRDLVAQMLECLGYKAITCANGEEAVSLYRDAKISGNPFLTVVMDLVVVEGMGGKDAAQHIGPHFLTVLALF